MIKKIRLRTWISLGVLFVLLPLALFSVIYWDSLLAALGGSSASPVAHWSFDEGADNTCPGGEDACDSSGGGHDGTFNSVARKDKMFCVSEGCIYQNSVNDYTNVSDHADLQFAGEDFSVSMWLYQMNLDDGTDNLQGIISKRGALATMDWQLYYDEGNVTLFDTQGVELNVNQWQHLVLTKSSTTYTLYIDDVQVAQETSAQSWTDSDGVAIGNLQTSGSWGFLGRIDEVKVFNSALTTAQIKAEFAGGAAIFGVEDPNDLDIGLIAYWPMDEAAADGCVTASADTCDATGQDQDGTWNADATFAAGKFGNGTTYDGTGDYTAGTVTEFPSTKRFTVSTWFKTSDTSGYILDTGDAGSGTRVALLTDGANTLWLYYDHYNGATNLVKDRHYSVTSTDNAWHHAVITRDGDNSVSIYVDGVKLSPSVTDTDDDITSRTDSIIRFRFGLRWALDIAPFDGEIDEARIYSRGFTQTEVTALYNWAPGPVGYWNFDEGSTTSAIDRSGNGNNGTVSNSPTVTNGKYGSALKYSGSSQDVAIGDGDGTIFDPTSITITAWIYPTSDANAGQIIDKAGNAGYRNVRNTDGTVTWYDRGGTNNVQTTNAAPLNSWTHVAVTGSASGLKIYLNGVLSASNATAYAPGNQAGGLFIRSTGLSETFDGIIDDVKLYNYERTPQQIVEDMNGGHPIGGSPVGSQLHYWNFDEMQGDTANDTIGTANGNLAGAQSGDSACPTWTTSGEFNGALDFDLAGTTDDYVSVASPNLPTGDFTYTMWINPDTAAGTLLMAADGAGNNELQLSIDSTDSNRLKIFLNTGANDAATTQSIATSTWTHLAVTRSGSAITIYVNGKQDGTGTDSATLDFSTCDLLIGVDADATCTGTLGEYFDGKIDEVKVYTSALTAEQIKVDMNAGANTNFGTGTDEKSTTYGGPGGNPPIRYYSFDENKDNTCTGGEDVCDKSGNDKDGTFNGNATFAPGKFGSAGSFDDSGDYVDMGSGSVPSTITPYTVSAWIYPTSLTGSGEFYCSNNGAYFCLYTVGNQIFFCGDAGVCGNTASSNTSILALNQWFHILMTYDGTTNYTFYVNGVNQTLDSTSGEGSTTLNIRIGGDGVSAWFGGKVDEVKWFDYVLSNAQIQYDFNRGAPVGWWQLDEGATDGQPIYDNSGNGNNGTTDNGANNTGMDCSVDAKLNKGCDFDGTDDYISISDNSVFDLTPSRGYSWSFWLKPDGFTEWSSFYAQDTDNGVFDDFIVYAHTTSNAVWGPVTAGISVGWDQDSANRLVVHTTNNAVTAGVWNHVTVTYDGTQSQSSRFKIFVNGVDKTDNSDVQSDGTISALTPASTTLGRNSEFAEFYAGGIDDFRYYLYALSASQVKKVMSGGSATGSMVNFGPSEGTP